MAAVIAQVCIFSSFYLNDPLGGTIQDLSETIQDLSGTIWDLRGKSWDLSDVRLVKKSSIPTRNQHHSNEQLLTEENPD